MRSKKADPVDSFLEEDIPQDIADYMDDFGEQSNGIRNRYSETLYVVKQDHWRFPSDDDVAEIFLRNRLWHIQLAFYGCFRHPIKNRWKIILLKRIFEVFSLDYKQYPDPPMSHRGPILFGHACGLMELFADTFLAQSAPEKRDRLNSLIARMMGREHPTTRKWDLKQAALAKQAAASIQLRLINDDGGFESGQLPFKIYLAMILYADFIDNMNSVTELHEFLCVGLGENVVGKRERLAKLCYRIGLKFKDKGAPRLKSDTD